MCFSLEASVAGGLVISSIGVASLNKVRAPSQILFASVPLVFGIQQLSEGVVWLALGGPEYAHLEKYGTYTFLFIARVLWPMLMPLAALMMEEDRKRKKILRVMLGMGLSVSLYYTYCLIFLNVAPKITGNHIQYISDFPESLAVPVFIIYFLAGVPPLFISSIKSTRLLGALMFIASVVTGIFYVEYLTSVWCFFAAGVSVVVYWIVREKQLIKDN